MNMLRNLAQAKAPQRLAPSQGILAFSPAEIRPFLHHKSAGPHHRRGILRLSGRQRRNGAEVGANWAGQSRRGSLLVALEREMDQRWPSRTRHSTARPRPRVYRRRGYLLDGHIVAQRMEIAESRAED